MSDLEELSEHTRDLLKQLGDSLQKETDALAVLLTGPHAMGLDRPQDKFYLVALTPEAEGVIEHRFLERYGQIDRQMEIGVFPRRFVEKLGKEGYWDMVSYRAAEALRAAVPLVDPSGYGRQSIEAMARHLPQRRFVSGHIHKVVATFDDAVSLYSKADYQGAVLIMREALRLAVELVVKTSAPQPDVDLDQLLRTRLGQEAYQCLLRALGMEETDEDDLRRHLDHLLAESRRILKDAGLPDQFLGE
jgi:hypothetical protein